MSDQTYIFVLQTRENSFKCGRTRQELTSWLREQSPHAEIWLMLTVRDELLCEQEIKTLLDSQFSPRPEIGSGYYEGDVRGMIGEIRTICTKLNPPVEKSGSYEPETDLFEDYIART